jgi:hypothetical protein
VSSNTESTVKPGTRFAIMPAKSREEADALAAAAGPESIVFAVRSSLSFPAKEWVAADPSFWRSAALSKISSIPE